MQHNPPSTIDVRPSAAADTPRLLRLPATLQRVALGRSAWLDLVREGKAPQPVKIGRSTAWVESEVSEWVRERIRSRCAPPLTARAKTGKPARTERAPAAAAQ